MADRLPVDEMGPHDAGGNGYVSSAEEESVHYESRPDYFETSVNTFYHRNPNGIIDIVKTNKDRRNIIDGLVEGCKVPPELEYDGETYRVTEDYDGSGLLVIKYLVHSTV